MSAQGVFAVTEQFEQLLCEYTGAPYAVAVDNCSNALFLALTRVGIKGDTIEVPSHTYPSVPCAVIHAGGEVAFSPCLCQDGHLTGPYPLWPTNVWDCALRFRRGMYQPGQTQCLSFTGPYKHLKLSKGGAILTDSAEDAAWYKRARFSGRNECSYHDDHFDMLGWNFYLLPELAARGILLMTEFLQDRARTDDLRLPFPDLSKHPAYQRVGA